MSQLNSEYLDELAGGFRAAQVLLAANRLRIFDALNPRPKVIEELSDDLNSSKRGLRILCDALVGLNILEKEGEFYCNSSFARHFLLEDSPDSRVAQLLHLTRLYAKWNHLTEAVREGKPIDDSLIDTELAASRTAFAKAMADSARSSARLTAEALDLSAVQRLLDVGGGPGVFAIEFARQNPQVQVTILDDEETLQVASEGIRKAGLEERIHLLPGDAFEDPLGGSFDFVFVSNLVHIYSAERNRFLIKKCAESLVPGGSIGIKDFFLREDGQGPVWSLLFAVNMLVNTEEGDCYSERQVREWFEAANLRCTNRIEITERSTLMIGTDARK